MRRRHSGGTGRRRGYHVALLPPAGARILNLGCLMGLEAHTTRQLAFPRSDSAARFLSNGCNDLQGRTVNEMPSTPGRGTSHRPPLSPRGHRRSPPPVACRSTVGLRTPILSHEDASGEMPRERLPAGRLGAARASALGTAAKRDGHALRGPRSRSICFLGRRRRLLLRWRRIEAGRACCPRCRAAPAVLQASTSSDHTRQ